MHFAEPGNGRCVVRHAWQYPHASPRSRARLTARIRYLSPLGSQSRSNSTGSHSRSKVFLTSRSTNQRERGANLPACGLMPPLVCIQSPGSISWNQIPAVRPDHWAIQERTSASFWSSVSAKPDSEGRSERFCSMSDRLRSDARASDRRPYQRSVDRGDDPFQERQGHRLGAHRERQLQEFAVALEAAHDPIPRRPRVRPGVTRRPSTAVSSLTRRSWAPRRTER